VADAGGHGRHGLGENDVVGEDALVLPVRHGDGRAARHRNDQRGRSFGLDDGVPDSGKIGRGGADAPGATTN